MEIMIKNKPLNERNLSVPNMLLLKRQTFIKMNLDLCLMVCLFAENLNNRSEEEEKRFPNDNSKVKCFHVRSMNRLTSIFSSGNSQEITAFYSCKTIQRRNQFCPKVNLIHDDGTQTVGHAIDNVNDMLSAETTDKNDNMIIINVPEPKWNIELRDYQCEDAFLANGFKVTLFEPIVMRFKRNYCISNYWITSNRCGK